MNVHAFGRAGICSLCTINKRDFSVLKNNVHCVFAIEKMIILHSSFVIEKMIIFVAVF